MTTVNFEVVSRSVSKNGKCYCGKRRVRSTTIENTINPFNKNKNGEIKSYEEVEADVQREAKEWCNEPITCDKCKNHGK